MAKRKSSSPNPSLRTSPPAASGESAVEQNVVYLAEQLGRMIGTVHAKADGLLDRETLQSELSAIRDAAAHLVTQISGGRWQKDASRPAKTVAPASPRRSRGAVDAPGKRHRKPAPSTHGAKHSDTRIAKVKLAKEGRPPRRG